MIQQKREKKGKNQEKIKMNTKYKMAVINQNMCDHIILNN